MKSALNKRDWWECSIDELWAMNLRQSDLIAQGDKCDRHCENQA